MDIRTESSGEVSIVCCLHLKKARTVKSATGWLVLKRLNCQFKKIIQRTYGSALT